MIRAAYDKHRALLTLVACAATLLTCGKTEPVRRTRAELGGGLPNVVVILADDLGYSDVAAYNPETFYETPRINRMAAEAVRFTSAYSSSPVCSPTRSSLLTGKYPVRMGTTNWFGAPQPDQIEPGAARTPRVLSAPYVDELPGEETTLAEALRESGYRTFYAGKWHLGGSGSYPKHHGFDVDIGAVRAGYTRSYFSPYRNPRLEDGPDGEYLPERLTQETVDFIDAHREEPFFAFLSFYLVHRPLDAPPELVEKYTEKAQSAEENAWLDLGHHLQNRLVQNHPVYAAMVESLDTAVGAVLDAIERAGIEEETIVVFTSDNGGESTWGDSPTSNLPLRAGKRWLYEGGIRVPLIIRWPGKLESKALPELVTSTDLFPTILEMAGLPSRPEQHLDGVSLLPLMTRGDALAREALYWHHPHYGICGEGLGSAVRVGDWKLIEYFDDARVELYNLAEDIGEQHDLSSRETEIVADLRARLDSWRSETQALLPTEVHFP